MVSLIVLERLSNTIWTHRTLMKDVCNSSSNANNFADMSIVQSSILDSVLEKIHHKIKVLCNWLQHVAYKGGSSNVLRWFGEHFYYDILVLHFECYTPS